MIFLLVIIHNGVRSVTFINNFDIFTIIMAVAVEKG